MPKFTDRFLSSFKVEPGSKDRLIFDTDCPGMGVRATAKGTRSFLIQWTDPATKRKHREPLGIWGNITLEQARKAASKSASARSRRASTELRTDPHESGGGSLNALKSSDPRNADRRLGYKAFDPAPPAICN